MREDPPPEVVEYSKDVAKSIGQYISSHPWLIPNRRYFYDLVCAREEAVLRRELFLCEMSGVRTTNDPTFRKIVERVESSYPTWEDIAEFVVAPKTVRPSYHSEQAMVS